MQDAPIMLILDINGRAETVTRPEARPQPAALQQPATQQRAAAPTESKETSIRELIEQMNGMAEELCYQIERDLTKMMPPYVTVRADLQFESGSLLLSGTVAILSWVGNKALDALKEQAQEQLSALVKMAVQRVMNRTLASIAPRVDLGPMDMTVTPRPLSTAATLARQPPALPAAASDRPTEKSPASGGLSSGIAAWVMWAVPLVLVLQVLLVLDRFFVLQLR